MRKDIFSLLPCEPDPFNGIDWRFLIRHRDLGPCARPQPGGQLFLSLTHLGELSLPGLKLFQLFKLKNCAYCIVL